MHARTHARGARIVTVLLMAAVVMAVVMAVMVVVVVMVAAAAVVVAAVAVAVAAYAGRTQYGYYRNNDADHGGATALNATPSKGRARQLKQSAPSATETCTGCIFAYRHAHTHTQIHSLHTLTNPQPTHTHKPTA